MKKDERISHKYKYTYYIVILFSFKKNVFLMLFKKIQQFGLIIYLFAVR